MLEDRPRGQAALAVAASAVYGLGVGGLNLEGVELGELVMTKGGDQMLSADFVIPFGGFR